MQQVAKKARAKAERTPPLRPLYTKLEKAINKCQYCIKMDKGKTATPQLLAKLNALIGFMAKHPSEDMCRRYIANNLSDIAEVMRGNWAVNLKTLKKLINQ